MSNVLEIKNLTIRYGTVTAVDNVDLTLTSGELCGLVGPNGSGKSSAFGAIAGLVHIASGTITIDGFDAATVEAKRSLGYAPDNVPLPDSLTAAETLDLHRLVHPGFDDRLVDELIELYELGDAMDRLVAAFSHGMRRKLRVLCALAHRPRLVVLDEPLTGLDPVSTILVRDTIRAVADAGSAVLVATHDLRSAAENCDRVAVLARGSIVATGSPAELCANHDAENLEVVFVAATNAHDHVEAKRQQLHRAVAAAPNPVIAGR